MSISVLILSTIRVWGGGCVGTTNRRFKPRFDSRRRNQACWRARSGIAARTPAEGGVWLGWSGKIAPGDELETRIVFAHLVWAERRPALAQAVMAPLICCSLSSSMFK